MPLVELDGDRISIYAEWRWRETIKTVPGHRYDERRNPGWYVPLSWASCVALRGVFGDELEIGPELNAWAAVEYATRVAPASALREADALDPQHPVKLILQELGYA